MPLHQRDVDDRDLSSGFQPARQRDPLDDVALGPALTANYKRADLCIRTGCQYDRVWRGMCARCAGFELGRIRKGWTDWAALESVSRALADDTAPPVAVLIAAEPYSCIVPGCHEDLAERSLCRGHASRLREKLRAGMSEHDAYEVVLGRKDNDDGRRVNDEH